jgi:hypothetical protein
MVNDIMENLLRANTFFTETLAKGIIDSVFPSQAFERYKYIELRL